MAGNTATVAKGGENATTGEVAQNVAITAEVTPGAQQYAPRAQGVAADQKQAGNTRIAGGTKTLAKLEEGLGRIQNEITSLINNCENGIGKLYTDASNIIGGYNSVLSPFVESIGSLQTGTIQIQQELNNAIEKDERTLENTDKDTDDKTINDRTRVGKENGIKGEAQFDEWADSSAKNDCTNTS